MEMRLSKYQEQELSVLKPSHNLHCVQIKTMENGVLSAALKDTLRAIKASHSTHIESEDIRNSRNMLVEMQAQQAATHIQGFQNPQRNTSRNISMKSLDRQRRRGRRRRRRRRRRGGRERRRRGGRGDIVDSEMFLVCGVVRIGLTKIDRRRVQQILDIPSLLFVITISSN